MAGGSRGPAPTPTHLKLVKGNPGKRPLNKKEPKPKGGLKDPPKDMPHAAKLEWRYIVSNAPEGLLTKVDRAVLRLYCESLALYKDARKGMDDDGLVTKTPNGMMQQSAWVGIANQAQKNILRCAQEMGLTPAARTRIQLADGGEGENPFAGHG